MRRGRQQVLFNFLPGKTFDHESGQFICKVTCLKAEEDTKINKHYLLDRISWLLNQWPEERRRGLPDPHQKPDNYLLAKPIEVEAELFPLLFECTNPRCRRVASYETINKIISLNPQLVCKTCGSPLIQIHHVLIHRCGNIRPLIIPRCPKHGYDHMWLDTRGSQKYAHFRWKCRNCSFQNPIIYGLCDDCNLPDRTMRPVVHRATTSYYPQYRTLINLPGHELIKILEDPDSHWLAIAAYLRLFNHGPNNRLIDLVTTPQGLSSEQESIATLERLIQLSPPDIRTSLQAKLEELRYGLSGQSQSRRNSLITKSKELIIHREPEIKEIGSELLELVRLEETLNITTLSQLEDKAQREMPSLLPLYRVAYRNALNETGLADVRLIGDFPVTTVIVGYTRDQRDANGSIIRAFPRFQKDDPRIPLFIDTVETEALIFHLNPVRVIRWLDLNGLTTGTLPDYNDDVAVRAWILNQMGVINPYNDIPDDKPVTLAIYGLVHSFSHLVLRQAVIQSGFDRTSLSEYLMPLALSFVIYSNNRTNFNIGGLYTLFEQTLHEHLRAVIDRSETCVYDPVCMEETGACHACMHVSEMSCEHFNRNLSRKYLFGRIESDGREFIGYWDMRCASGSSS